MKAVGSATAVVTELLFAAYELTTWKIKLRKKIGKGLDKWQDETCKIVIEDLAKLREENIQTIIKIADQFAHSFEEEKPTNIDKCIEEYNYAKSIAKRIGIE